MKQSLLRQCTTHLILILGVIFMITPIWIAFMSSTHDALTLIDNGVQYWIGDNFWQTYQTVLIDGGGVTKNTNALKMLGNSMVLGLGFAIGKVIISMLAAYALVYFRFRLATPLFWIIFSTLLLPLEVRIVPSFQVVAEMGLLNSYTGLIVPLIASATGTFYFRQYFKSVPDELLEAARLDGAGPFRFFIDILVPLSKTMMAAIFIIMFVFGWNQYLWPLIMTTDEDLYTIVIGIKRAYSILSEGGEIPRYNEAFALIFLAVLPPAIIILVFQRMFVKGLVDTEK